MNRKAIAVCPKCKGNYILCHSNPFYGNPSWTCNDCGFHAPVAVKSRKKSSYI